MSQPVYGSLSAAVAKHVASTPFSALPASTISATRRALLDGLGVMLAASGMSTDVQPFMALARTLGGPPEALILGTRERVSAAGAAFANGAMAHALDYEDAFDLAAVHPNASLIPAALAVASTLPEVTGAEFLTAMAIGCDLVCRLALSVRRPLEAGGWYPPPILGAFGAAAAAARLLRLTPEQVSDAFSLMLCQTACPGEIKYSGDSTIRAVREAFPAQAAVLAVALAKRGVKGFAAPLEGKAGFFKLFCDGQFAPDPILEQLGERYWTEQLSFKPWPCCRGTHAYVEAIQSLKRQVAFPWTDVERVRLTGGEIQQFLADPAERKRRPATSIEAKFSLPFVAATALVKPDITLDAFLPPALSDPDVRAAAERVEFIRGEGWTRERATAGIVELVFRDGRCLERVIEQAPGHPDQPLSDARLQAKFVDCAARAAEPWSEPRALEFCALILSLERAPRLQQLLDSAEASPPVPT